MAETAFYSETLKDKYYLSEVFNNHHDTPPNFLCELKSQTVLCGHTISTAILLLIINIIIIIIVINKQESPAIADKPARREPKLLQFDMPTTLSLTILAYLHAFNCYCVGNPRNPEKFTENSNLWSSRSSKVIDIGVNRKPICDLLLVINSNPRHEIST